MDDMVLIQNIVLAYEDNVAVDHLSLTIQPGSFIGLIGPNGAGKTTLMLSMAGQFQPASGSIFFQGLDIYGKNLEYKRKIGFVHENPFFYPYLSVEEFLWFIARVRRMDKRFIGEKIDNVLRAVKLYDEREKLTVQLSQGMRKKLAIAAALLNSPRILFLDEAINGVDVESVFYIKGLLADYVASGGTVILSTHVLDIIEKLCDRYVVLHQGRIIADLDDETATKGKTAASLESIVLDLLKSEKA